MAKGKVTINEEICNTGSFKERTKNNKYYNELRTNINRCR